jgi:hypothetical protein
MLVFCHLAPAVLHHPFITERSIEFLMQYLAEIHFRRSEEDYFLKE